MPVRGSFSGASAGQQRRVDLRGRSKGEETRAQTVERTRLEREQRLRRKLENASATALQAAWRGRQARRALHDRLRTAWQAEHGAALAQARGVPLGEQGGLLRGFCAFCEPGSAADVQALAAVCRLIQLPVQGTGADAGLVGFRAQRLAALALASLRLHAQAVPSLWQLHAAASPPGPAATLISLAAFLQTVTDPASWPAPAARPGPSQGVYRHLVRRGLFPYLADLLGSSPWPPGPPWRGSPFPHEDSSRGQPMTSGSGPSVAEQLVACMVARGLSAERGREGRGGWDAPGDPVGGEAASEVGAADWVLLLGAPLLWQRCPSLGPISIRLWSAAVAQLGSSPLAEGLERLLPQQKPQGALSALCLLGNLGQLAPAALEAPGQPSAARDFAAILSTLLARAPLRATFPSSFAFARDQEAEEEPLEPGTPGSPSQPESLPAAPPLDGPLRDGLQEQLQVFLRGTILQPLLQHLLPLPPAGGPGAGPGASPGDVRLFCGVATTVMEADAALAAATAQADAVTHLWAAYLKAYQAAPSHTAEADAAAQLALRVLSRVYASYLATAGSRAGGRGLAGGPIPQGELYQDPSRGLLPLLKQALWQALWVESSPTKRFEPREVLPLSRVITLLHDHNSRRPTVPPEAFLVEGLTSHQLGAELAAEGGLGTLSREEPQGGERPGKSHRVTRLLRYAPCLVGFRERARLFQDSNAAVRAAAPFLATEFIQIRRDHLLEDGFEALKDAGGQMQLRIRIAFVDVLTGEVEAGVDGGGLFKDFLEGLLREGFDPARGLFRLTAHNTLHPAPTASTAHAKPRELYHFLGMMLGKALFEGILLELPLAPFFLKALLGRECELADLPDLDPTLASSLAFVLDYEGDFEALALSFVLEDDALGATRQVELVAGGRDRPVTAANRHEYVLRCARYWLAQQGAAASRAFREGMEACIDPVALSMFNEQELQTLIGGGENRGLDLEDLRTHVNYGNGYTPQHPVIQTLWQALASMGPQEQGAFLRFVTSCSRPPLLGFRYLEPRLGIARTAGDAGEAAQQRLPTASTCMNLLKLPPYQSLDLMLAKLRTALGAASGFDLS